MNPAQTSLYWREWALCSAALKRLGHKGDDSQRRSLQASAIGERVKSSKHLTNAELDAVLARFRSYSRADDLDTQLAALDAGPKRQLEILARCLRAVRAILGGGTTRDHAENYIDATARRMFAQPARALPEPQLLKVMGSLERSAARAKTRAPAPGHDFDPSAPFG